MAADVAGAPKSCRRLLHTRVRVAIRAASERAEAARIATRTSACGASAARRQASRRRFVIRTVESRRPCSSRIDVWCVQSVRPSEIASHVADHEAVGGGAAVGRVDLDAHRVAARARRGSRRRRCRATRRARGARRRAAGPPPGGCPRRASARPSARRTARGTRSPSARPAHRPPTPPAGPRARGRDRRGAASMRGPSESAGRGRTRSLGWSGARFVEAYAAGRRRALARVPGVLRPPRRQLQHRGGPAHERDPRLPVDAAAPPAEGAAPPTSPSRSTSPASPSATASTRSTRAPATRRRRSSRARSPCCRRRSPR